MRGTLNNSNMQRGAGNNNKSLGAKSHSRQTEVNSQVSDVLAEVLTAGQVKIGQVRDLLAPMAKHFKFFKTAFLALIDRVLVIEEKDQLIKHVYTLISKFFGELSKTQLNPGKHTPANSSS